MANKRMFSNKITDTDSFLDMPLSTQCLYFHLNMNADDDGFVGNPKRILRMVCASEDDLKLLKAKSFVLEFESGVIVIKHWRVHNTLSKNRYSQTTYLEEKSMLLLKDNMSYSFTEGHEIDDSKLLPNKCGTDEEQSENTDKNRIDKNREEEIRLDENRKEEIKIIVQYLNEKTNSNYKSNTDATVKHINARLNEGFTVDDFKTVIDKKCDEWIGTDWEKYLRPNTLFSTKFEQYYNQKNRSEKKNNSYAGMVFE